MKLPILARSIVPSLALAVAALPALRAADTPPPPPHAEHSQGGHAAHAAHAGQHTSDSDTELGDRMDEMGDAFKALRKQIDDPAKNASSLQQVAILKKNATAALNLVPAKAADLPEGDRAKFVADYKTEMKKLLGRLDELQTSLEASNNAAAAKTLKTIGAEQKDAHREFRKPQD